MKRFSEIGVLSILVVLLCSPSRAENASTPDRVQGSREVYFYSISSLKVEGGRVSSRGLPTYLGSTLESYLLLPATTGCVRLYPFEKESDQLVPRSSLAEASQRSEGVLRGEVVGLGVGFRSTGEGGTVLKVEAKEIIKGKWLRTKETYFVFIPVGKFEFGGRQFCAEADDWATLPKVGDEVLLFVPFQGWSDQSFLEIYDAAGLVVLKGDGSSGLPSRYSQGESNRGLSAKDVLRLVAEASEDPEAMK